MEEAGLKDFRINNHFGIVAPKGTPAAITKALGATLQKVLADPELLTSMKAQGVELKYQGPAEMSALINTELALWAKVAKAANVKVE
jgi:tripartite-type tricarboxylate transporter receptor subunit TctC